MKYFIDTEFLEGTQKEKFPISLFRKNTPPTIDLISIALVSEDNREYYAISKDFNLEEAWNRYDEKHLTGCGDTNNLPPTKVYWIRENVLKPIFYELNQKDLRGQIQCLKDYGYPISKPLSSEQINFTYSRLKYLINKHGKTNKQIAEEVKVFCTEDILSIEKAKFYKVQHKPCNFYAYYADYDWVVFCWLFGKMIDLPKGFPMYCIDLKQIMDEKVDKLETYQISKIVFPDGTYGFTNDKDEILSVKIDRIKISPNYPKQTNEHNALADARWTKELYEFLNTL